MTSRSRSPAARCAQRWPKRPEPSEEKRLWLKANSSIRSGFPSIASMARLKVTGKAPLRLRICRARRHSLWRHRSPLRSPKAASPRWMCSDAQSAPGVRLVLTKDNAPPQHPFGPVDLPDRFARAMPALNNDEVPYFGFPVAFVVADTFEQATAAAAMVRVHYAAARGAYDLHAAGPDAIDPGRISTGVPADSTIGDFNNAFANAPGKDRFELHHALSGPDAHGAAWRRWRCGMGRSSRCIRRRS